MGQSLRRATGKATSSAFNPPTPAPATPNPAKSAGRRGQVAADQLGDATGPENLTRLSNDSNVLEERDPGYDAMLGKMVGRVSTKPGGKLEMGEAFIVERYKRPLPKLRSSKAEVSGDEQKPPPGTVDVAQIKQILLLHQGNSEDYQGSMTADDIAKQFGIDVTQVQKILQFVSLPPEGNNRSQ